MAGISSQKWIDGQLPDGSQATPGQIEVNSSNTTINTLAGYGVNYGDKEARLALAIADATGGSSGGNSGLTQAQVQAAMTNALTSQNQIEFQEMQFEDANGVLYIRIKTVDEETGATAFANILPNGAAHTPALPVTPVGSKALQDIKDNTYATGGEATYYRVMNGNGVDTTTNDYVVKYVRFNPAGLDSVIWLNITTGSLVPISAPQQTDLKVWNRLVDDAVNQTADNTANSYGQLVQLGQIAGKEYAYEGKPISLLQGNFTANQVIATIDTEQFAINEWISLRMHSFVSGNCTLAVQCSVNGVNWINPFTTSTDAINFYNQDGNLLSTNSIQLTPNFSVFFKPRTRYFRVINQSVGNFALNIAKTFDFKIATPANQDPYTINLLDYENRNRIASYNGVPFYNDVLVTIDLSTATPSEWLSIFIDDANFGLPQAPVIGFAYSHDGVNFYTIADTGTANTELYFSDGSVAWLNEGTIKLQTPYFFKPKARFVRILDRSGADVQVGFDVYTSKGVEENITAKKIELSNNYLANLSNAQTNVTPSITKYVAIAASTQVNIGDIVSKKVISPYFAPASESFTGWKNETTKVANIVAPPDANLILLDQLRKTAKNHQRFVNNNSSVIQIKPTNAYVRDITIDNLSASVIYVGLHENLSVPPVNGNVPNESYRVFGNGSLSVSIDRILLGQVFLTISSTAGAITTSSALKNLIITYE